MITLPLTLLACGDDGALDDTGAGGTDRAASDEAIAEQLWSDIDGYAAWSQYDPWIGVQPSASLHGPYVQIWLNDAAVASVGGMVSDGGILVKEGYDAEDGAATGITVMAKMDGYDADHADWFWASFGTDGSVQESGSESGCYGCHEAGTDYVLIVSTDPAGDTGGK